MSKKIILKAKGGNVLNFSNVWQPVYRKTATGESVATDTGQPVGIDVEQSEWKKSAEKAIEYSQLLKNAYDSRETLPGAFEETLSNIINSGAGVAGGTAGAAVAGLSIFGTGGASAPVSALIVSAFATAAATLSNSITSWIFESDAWNEIKSEYHEFVKTEKDPPDNRINTGLLKTGNFREYKGKKYEHWKVFNGNLEEKVFTRVGNFKERVQLQRVVALPAGRFGLYFKTKNPIGWDMALVQAGNKAFMPVWSPSNKKWLQSMPPNPDGETINKDFHFRYWEVPPGAVLLSSPDTIALTTSELLANTDAILGGVDTSSLGKGGNSNGLGIAALLGVGLYVLGQK